MIGRLRSLALLSARARTSTRSRRSRCGSARWPTRIPAIAELDLNPVMVGPDGARVVDARVRVAPPAVQPVFPAVGR